MSAVEHTLDPLDRAIAAELTIKDLRTQIKDANRQVEQARSARDKAKIEADQQRERGDKLRSKLDKAVRDAKQDRHALRQKLDKAEATLAKIASRKETYHQTYKSKDEQMVVQLAYNQVHISEPDRWYMISSMPLDKAPKHRLIFCGLIDGVKQGDYGDFAVEAAHKLAREWRKAHSCLRVEDLDLTRNVARRLEDAEYELASEIHNVDELAKIKGIGPAALKQIDRALRKDGLK